MEYLPKEIVTHILSFLDIKDVIHCSEINRYWNDITNTDWVWKRFCINGVFLNEYQEIKAKQCTLQPYCYWKWYYVNFERITQNWLRRKFKKHELLLNSPDSVYKMATYDGCTLVICYTSSIRVIKVTEGNLLDLQTFFLSESMLTLLNSVSTNTLYIILNCGKVVAVYKLVDNHYEGACMFYKMQSQPLKHSTKENIFSKKIVKSFFSGNICGIGSVIQANYLYIHAEKKIYIWDLIKMECQIEIDAISFLIAQDKKNIYICPDHHIIRVFGNNSQSFLSMETTWKISQIEINHDILLALEEELPWEDEEDSSRKICAWNKLSGVKLFEISLALPDFCFLHPRREILLGNISSGDNVCAISPQQNSLLWFRVTRRKENPFADRILATGFRTLAADRFIITMVDSGICYHMIDSKTGKSLYTFENSEIKYVGFDILLHTDSFRKNLFVRIYS